jgi:hypothetical protein
MKQFWAIDGWTLFVGRKDDVNETASCSIFHSSVDAHPRDVTLEQLRNVSDGMIWSKTITVMNDGCRILCTMEQHLIGSSGNVDTGIDSHMSSVGGICGTIDYLPIYSNATIVLES